MIKSKGSFWATKGVWQFLISLSLVVLVGAGYYYWENVYSTPDAVFKRMLSQSMRTTAVTRIANQTGSGQSVAITSQQTTAPLHQVRALNVLTQGEGTQITTENITTTDKNFVRYTDIQTDQGRSDGTPFDFNQILNLWGEVPATANDNSVATIYTGNVVVPVANLTPQQQEQLLQQIITDKVYELDYQNIQTETLDGRKTYSYSVTVNPVPYIKMLKTLTAMLNQDQLKDLNPEQYANVEPLKFQMYVDVLSSQLVKIIYSDTAQSTELYTGYGARDTAPLPTDTIPLTELQTRLQQLQ